MPSTSNKTQTHHLILVLDVLDVLCGSAESIRSSLGSQSAERAVGCFHPLAPPPPAS